jgi:hypothetical protein
MKTKLPSLLDFMIVVESNILCDEEFLRELEKHIDEERVGIMVEQLYDFMKAFTGEKAANIIYALYTLLYLFIALAVEGE